MKECLKSSNMRKELNLTLPMASFGLFTSENTKIAIGSIRRYGIC